MTVSAFKYVIIWNSSVSTIIWIENDLIPEDGEDSVKLLVFLLSDAI